MSDRLSEKRKRKLRAAIILKAGYLGIFIAGCAIIGAVEPSETWPQVLRRPWYVFNVITFAIGVVVFERWEDRTRFVIPERVRDRLFNQPLAAICLGVLAGWVLYATIPGYGNYGWHRVIRSCLTSWTTPGLDLLLLLFFGYCCLHFKRSELKWWRSLAAEPDNASAAAE